MKDIRRNITGRSRSRPRRSRPFAWLFALLVMCFAVVPHVTLAASLMPMPGHAHQREALAAAPAEPGADHAPCHQANPAEHAAALKPPCCVVGCGLIAELPAPPLLLERIARSRSLPPAVSSASDQVTEPAEPPPRGLAAI